MQFNGRRVKGWSMACITAVFCSEAGVHLYSDRGFLGAGRDLQLIQPALKCLAMQACLLSTSHLCIPLSSWGHWPGEHGQGVMVDSSGATGPNLSAVLA